MMRTILLSIACLSAVALPLQADTSLQSDAELATLRQTILAAANGEARLETSPEHGLLNIMDHIDGETGEHDRWTRLYCGRADIEREMQFFVDEDLQLMRVSLRAGGHPLSCSRAGDGVTCRLSLGRDDGGPTLVEMLFRRGGLAHLTLETLVSTGDGNPRRYINAQLHHPHACK